MTLALSIEHARELARLRAHEARPDFVLIGAAALGHHVTLARTTSDVDIALVVAPTEIVAMLTSLGWRQHTTVEHRWDGPHGFRADVLPATPELIDAGAVKLDGESRVMSLVGFDLAFAHATEVELPGPGVTVKVASLASIVVLKMVSWLDRPHERTRDLGDLATVLRDALRDDDDRRWDAEHPIGSRGLAFDDQSPFFVGLEVSAIASRRHRDSIDRFVNALTNDSASHAAVMARAAGLRAEDPELRARRMVELFALALRGGLP